MVAQISYAKLDKEDVSKLQKLEKETGKLILAYEPTRESPYADLANDQVEQLRKLEKDWNVILLAYKKK